MTADTPAPTEALLSKVESRSQLDPLRKAAQAVVDRWFLHLDRENDKALRTAMIALRAAARATPAPDGLDGGRELDFLDRAEVLAAVDELAKQK
jgi:hypothetical protein